MLRSSLTQFGVSTTPWASGKSVADVKSMKEAMEIASCDFSVETSQVQMRVSDLTDEMVEEALLSKRPTTYEGYRKMINSLMQQCYQGVPAFNVIRRSDTLKPFGVCGNKWNALQNVDAFNWFQPALDEDLVKLNTVGTIGGGRKIWILAEINADPCEIVPGDEIVKYLLLGNGHDGGTALFIAFTPLRVWCANMFPRLKRDKSTQLIRLRHSMSVKVHLDRLRDTINFANAEFNATAEQYRKLCNHTINKADLEKYVKVLFCDAKEQAKPLADLPTRTRNRLEEIMSLVDTGIGLQGPKVRGTYYAAFNAVNQYLNYDASRNAENRLNSLWFGQNANLNQKALQVATEMALAV